jgi:hypothetical protein
MLIGRKYLCVLTLLMLSCSDEANKYEPHPSSIYSGAGISQKSIESTITFSRWKGSSVYTKDMASEDFKDWVTSDDFIVEHSENLSVDDEGSLTFTMRKGKIWPEGSGSQIILPVKPAKQYTLEYSVYFDGGIDPYHWTSGGKLPGIAGGKGYTGGNSANAGDGFSARLMFGYDQAVWAYVYHKDMKGKYGEALGISKGKAFKLNEWNTVRIEYRMNSGEQYDGSMRLTVNGILVGENNRIRFRTNDCPIDKLLIVAFHGGASDDYRPSHDQAIKFKWFNITSE